MVQLYSVQSCVTGTRRSGPSRGPWRQGDTGTAVTRDNNVNKTVPVGDNIYKNSHRSHKSETVQTSWYHIIKITYRVHNLKKIYIKLTRNGTLMTKSLSFQSSVHTHSALWLPKSFLGCTNYFDLSLNEICFLVINTKFACFPFNHVPIYRELGRPSSNFGGHVGSPNHVMGCIWRLCDR